MERTPESQDPGPQSAAPQRSGSQARSRSMYAGFDLGTTNSAAAVFDGEQITLIRNAQGSALTPSAVRIDSRGRTMVGTRARRYLDTDPENTYTEFKRLMGTGTPLAFPAAGLSRSPAELAAQILGSLRTDIRDQLGVTPIRAVISVPALFELPQNSATSEAARIAGFEQVELLQEPIASALAAGWKADDSPGTWMVYDMGGGTFDVSLLESRDGLLRVVGHDGDNFLGGRDFDAVIVDWLIDELAAAESIRLDRSNPAHTAAIRALRRAAEEAKIELSRSTDTDITLPNPLKVEDHTVEFDFTLKRHTLEDLCLPVIDRSLIVCHRLLKTHGLVATQIERVVLVGGPTLMPLVRQRLQSELAAPVAEGHDPMTLVAQGAAIYAATAGLDAHPEVSEEIPSGYRLWLQFPPVSADLTPHVVGRVTMSGTGSVPVRIRLVRDDGAWTSPEAVIDAEGAFVLITDLRPRRPNVFTIEAVSSAGAPVDVYPRTIKIVQGITISDPPLSRTVGVALANDLVHVYFERGASLPARRTFTHHTVESVAKGAEGSVLKIPIVQGEFEKAHLCRLVGTLEIRAERIEASVPSDSPVEVTIELDRGGRLSATALVSATGQVFEEVAHLLVPEADAATLESSLLALRQRTFELRTDAFRHGWTDILGPLDDAETRLTEVERDIISARGGDEDAGQKARRALIELDAAVDEAELKRCWPELEDRAVQKIAWASDWVSRYGTPAETRLMDEVIAAVEQARESHNPNELERQLRLAQRLGNSAFYRHPSAWQWMFESAASEIDQAYDLPRAQDLVNQGRDAIARNDTAQLRTIVENLWRLLPTDVQTRRLSFDSGVR